MTKAQSQTAKKPRRKPASFRVEDVEIVMPPKLAPLPDEPETEAEVTGLPKLERGLRWGSIFLGALGGLIGLLASLWLYDYVLALIARDDWIGWVAVVLLGLVLVALLMIILRELVGLMRLGNVPGTTDNRGNTLLLKETGLGRKGHGTDLFALGELARKTLGGRAGGAAKTGHCRERDGFDRDLLPPQRLSEGLDRGRNAN